MTQTPSYPIVAPEHIKQSRIIDLTLYKNNPRVHSEIQIERLVNSLKEFGFTNPVLIDDTGNVIAGHGMITAAKKNWYGFSSNNYPFSSDRRATQSLHNCR